MTDQEKRRLVIEHAQLTAAHAAGNAEARNRLQEIEDILQLSAAEIASVAVTSYLKDY
jgi:hypothetical protein